MMGGLRNWMFLDEHAELVRNRVVSWELHPAHEADATPSAPHDYDQLRQMLAELHDAEEELRIVAR